MMEVVRIAVEEAKRQIFQEGVEEGVQQGIHLVTRMLESKEDASKIPLLDQNGELYKEMLAKYNIVS